MRKTAKILSLSLALLFVLFAFAACVKGVAREGLWKEATYNTDKTFGKGATTITLVVIAEDQSVTFTIKTDKEMLGDALLEHGLIEGENSTYGLMVNKVNGMEASWEKDQAYWALYIGSDYAMTGVDSTPVTAGTQYGFTYTK
ncbi:MAG: hypothetical protein IJR88_00430 [Clostridia bacterium]|nr:hypothetical protein [Clostridia bacterium]